MVYGVGISLGEASNKLIELASSIPNSVIHVIAGLVQMNQLYFLAHNDLKILILGYKQVRRDMIDYNINSLKNYIPHIVKEKWFSIVSFDNLAIKQLGIKGILTENQWNEFYMGDDGQDGKQTSASMFVDMVERKFAKNSCAPECERYDLLDTAEDMYAVLRGIDNGRQQ